MRFETPATRVSLSRPANDAGARVYTEYCMHCHGVDGRGFAPMLAPLAGNPNVLEHDASSLINIAKAIQSSDTGLSPNSDGRVIRLNVPALSTERRRQLSGRVKELAEEARVAIRNVR